MISLRNTTRMAEVADIENEQMGQSSMTESVTELPSRGMLTQTSGTNGMTEQSRGMTEMPAITLEDMVD